MAQAEPETPTSKLLNSENKEEADANSGGQAVRSGGKPSGTNHSNSYQLPPAAIAPQGRAGLESVRTTRDALLPLRPGRAAAITQAGEAVAQAAPSPPTEHDGLDVEVTDDGRLRITVTGTRTPRDVDDLPATVTVFDLEDFNFNQIQNLQDLLRYEPGVSVRDDPRFGCRMSIFAALRAIACCFNWMAYACQSGLSLALLT
ncbi:MAG: hypothetical protein HC929_03610 [Leptolyngbyaceae cyanobacterium SM2_5_2]|nr:hypothetical protein [Leptolyngbyaceae cyanobacterium SM2_5_2]